MIVGVIYRHPNTSYVSFKEQLCKIKQNFSRSNNTFVLMGDYNIDISKKNIDNKIQNYVNEINSSGFFFLINKPTRITSTSVTTLDHIYSNSLQKISVSGILISDVSDHLPTFCIMKSNIYRSFTPGIMIRDIKNLMFKLYLKM